MIYYRADADGNIHTVEAMQYTVGNKHEIIEFTDGKAQSDSMGHLHLTIPLRTMRVACNTNSTSIKVGIVAHYIEEGDWVTKSGTGFGVWGNTEFSKYFTLMGCICYLNGVDEAQAVRYDGDNKDMIAAFAKGRIHMVDGYKSLILKHPFEKTLEAVNIGDRVVRFTETRSYYCEDESEYLEFYRDVPR